MYNGSNIEKSDFHLHHQHFNAVKSLFSYDIIVICKSDKGFDVVILKKHDYVHKMDDKCEKKKKYFIEHEI